MCRARPGEPLALGSPSPTGRASHTAVRCAGVGPAVWLNRNAAEHARRGAEALAMSVSR